MTDDLTDSLGFEWKSGRVIPWSEIGFVRDTGGGPGGQHVNRTATRVTLIWTPRESSAFSDDEIQKIEQHVTNRLNRHGELRLRSAGERSARRNQDSCLELFGELIRQALTPRRRRRPTKPTKGSKRRRLDEKKRRGDVKRARRKPRTGY